jgi:hypothetical protein
MHTRTAIRRLMVTQAEIRLRHVERMKKRQLQQQEQQRRDKQAQQKRAVEEQTRNAKEDVKLAIIRRFGMAKEQEISVKTDDEPGSFRRYLERELGSKTMSAVALSRQNESKLAPNSTGSLLPSADSARARPNKTRIVDKFAQEAPVYYQVEQLLQAYKDREEVPSYVYLPVSLTFTRVFCVYVYASWFFCVYLCDVYVHVPVLMKAHKGVCLGGAMTCSCVCG